MAHSRNNPLKHSSGHAGDRNRLVLARDGHCWTFSWGDGDETALLRRVDALSLVPGSGLDRGDAVVIRHQLEELHPDETIFGLH